MDIHGTSNSEESSSSKITRRDDCENDPNDDTMDDADELEEEATSKGRGMSMEYVKIETLPDYPSSLKYMIDKMPG